MKDSHEFHAICLDTFPPIFYLNDTSQTVIKLCHFMNDWYENEEKFLNEGNKYMVCYTFDAGPNAVLITRNTQCLNLMLRAIRNTFFNANKNNSLWIEDKLKLSTINDQNNQLKLPKLGMQSDGIEKIILTQLGGGARILNNF
eukprot:UN00053